MLQLIHAAYKAIHSSFEAIHSSFEAIHSPVEAIHSRLDVGEAKIDALLKTGEAKVDALLEFPEQDVHGPHVRTGQASFNTSPREDRDRGECDRRRRHGILSECSIQSEGCDDVPRYEHEAYGGVAAHLFSQKAGPRGTGCGWLEEAGRDRLGAWTTGAWPPVHASTGEDRIA